MSENRVFTEGEKIYLRPLSIEDAEGNYLHWFDDEEVCKFNSHHRFPYSKKNLIEYLSTSSKNKIVLAIIYKKDDNHVGNISLQEIDYINRSAEIAFLIGEKKYWGRGIAKEAGFLIISHGFSNLNLNRIYCGTSSENIGMQKLAFSLGFKEEGRRRKAFFKSGNYYDIIEYGLLRAEFNQDR